MAVLAEEDSGGVRVPITRVNEKLSITLNAVTFITVFGAVIGAAFFIGGQYQSWTHWRESASAFMADQRVVNETTTATLNEIKSRLPVRRADAQ